MLIVSKLFQVPTDVELPNGHDENGERIFRSYHFAEIAPGVFGAEVENEEHLGRLLAIPEAFKLSLPAAPARSLVQPDNLPPPPVPPVPQEPADQPTPLDEPEAGEEGGGEEAGLVTIQPSYDDMTEEEARAAFEAMFGRKAHHKTSREKIIAALKDGPAADSASDQEG